MSGKTTLMSRIKQLLLLHQDGKSNRLIAKKLGINKGTVNEYVQKLKTVGMEIDELLQLDDPVLEGRFFAGTAAYTDRRYDDFRELLPYFEKELQRKHVTRHIIWQEYLSKHSSGYRYTQFCYHLNQQLAARKPDAVLTHQAGEKLFVDFAGDKMEYIDIGTGEAIPVQVFVACLPFSDYTFTMAVKGQTTEDFLYALSCCLQHLDGSPKIIVPDNLKAAIVKADRYEPDLNRTMEDFANHYGFVVIPARVARPKDKAKVENEVKIIYSRVYAKLRNHRFFSLEELNRAMAGKTTEHNQTRMQQRDYSRMEKFLADERQLLRPLPQTAFELKYYTELHVGQNNHVYLGRDKRYYSVPYIHTGAKVQLVYTRTMVKIFLKNEQIAVHQRVMGRGYSTVNEHLCSEHQQYNKRNPDRYISAARQKSTVLAELVERIFSGSKPPELYYKTCEGLFSLYRKSERDRFEKACNMALTVGNISYGYIKSIIESNRLLEPNDNYKPLPSPEENIRGKQYYK
jgi:transposase